ncbi:MAG: bifunctional diaminohydroxyphosphoribosylaminopyrimidine deaminase/5-amino-6-(5-phosphoribosylamino)uracil reductase RibD [Pseudomonadota bacterium]
MDDDEKFMKEALRQAGKGAGRTSPNPAVGVVIVRDGKIIASGHHERAGGDHAEVSALNKLGGKAMPKDTLYVTLEPCSHFGKTPPCTEAILAAGLKRVVIGMKDPNPKVSGGGSRFLAGKGLEVRTGILETECLRLNEDFVKFITTGRPFVIAKSAMTLDGWTAASTGHSQWVTSEESRQFVHRLRNRVDGVMVGIGTVAADDPRLTTRLAQGKGRDPVRIVLDTHLRMAPDRKVLNHGSRSETLVIVGEKVSMKARKRVQKENVSVLVCKTRGKRIDLAALMDKLGERDIMSLLMEGGATLMGQMIRERLVDKFYLFKAPKILGGNDGISMASGAGPKRMDECLMLRDVKIRRFGEDALFIGYPGYNKKSLDAD